MNDEYLVLISSGCHDDAEIAAHRVSAVDAERIASLARDTVAAVAAGQVWWDCYADIGVELIVRIDAEPLFDLMHPERCAASGIIQMLEQRLARRRPD